jgi:regulator of ribonuclease activity A
MDFKTTDLCDEFSDRLQVAEPIFGDYGGEVMFSGAVVTVKVFEDNSLVRSALEEPGDGRVLAIAEIPIGVKAVGVHPLKSVKRGVGERDIPVRFAGVTFQPGYYVYGDEDGLLVSEKPLL